MKKLGYGHNRKNTKILKKDNYGLIYSTDLLLALIMLIVILAVIANLSDDLNERMLSSEEFSNLEKLAVESSDYMLNNPGVPEDWESKIEEEGHINRNIIPGLAKKDKFVRNGKFRDESSSSEKVVENTISYSKLIKLNGHYDDLIDKNLFNDSFESSIAIYPINAEIEPIMMGDNLDDNLGDVVSVNRTVKCDFLSNYVIYNFNDFELYGSNYERETSCNHDNVKNLQGHENTNNYFWLCKSFRIYRNSLENYSYYLISPNNINSLNVHWTLDSLNNTSDDKNSLNNDVINLNNYFEEDLNDKYNNIYTIHFEVPKEKADNFKALLVAIPKDYEEDLKSDNQLKYDYFRQEDVNFVFKLRIIEFITITWKR